MQNRFAFRNIKSSRKNGLNAIFLVYVYFLVLASKYCFVTISINILEKQENKKSKKAIKLRNIV